MSTDKRCHSVQHSPPFEALGVVALRAIFSEKIVYPRLKEQDAKIFYEAGEEHHVVDLLIAELMQHYDGCNGRECETL
jgi:hypothetical protein